ncbi:hypothetical protein D3C75_1338070 [compost metagenome]
MLAKAWPMRSGPSSHHDNAKNGSGGISPPQITSATRSTEPKRRVMILPMPHMAPAHRVSSNASNGT